VTNPTSPTERVGRYQLLEPIGIGPSGGVSRAKVFGVAGFERQFAVKRFHAELTATAAMAAMLSAAARAYGSLEHPRIARMSEFGVAQGATFTAVEYVLGLDALRLIGEARLAGSSLAAGGALALVSQAARAVGYAHGRGLTHLGLAPTNVIVTAEGDIKITDFGILSATLPPRPTEVPRLAQRIPYLAPEQLANEATSAATDVFALGVLAYELITGTRTFKGDTPQQVASAIMAGPPAEPPLPRPIVRVLQRCLARSPFERFPDARALADALDAALRVAPVPGTRKDIGAQVKETCDRLAALNDGQMSGVVALHLGTGPIRRLDDDDLRRADERDSYPRGRDLMGGPATVMGGPVTVGGPMPSGGPATIGGPVTVGGPMPSSGPATIGGPVGRPLTVGGPATTGLATTGLATLGPSPAAGGGPASTVQDLPRYPITTVPGLPPPPIPVPAGLGAPGPTAPPGQPGAQTLLGVGKSPPAIPSRPVRPGSSSGLPSAKPAVVPPVPRRAGTRPGTDLAVPIEPVSAHARIDAAHDGPIHTLDANDLVSLDGGMVEAVELDAFMDSDSDSALEADDDAPSVTRPGTPRATAAARDSQPGISSDRPAGTPPARPPRSVRVPDPGAADKPIAPLVLEPLLFDPIDRSPIDRATPPAPPVVDSEAVTLDEDDGFESPADRVAAASAPPGDPAADPRLGQTILGFAAPLPLPRAATAPPYAEADHDPPAADVSEMLREGLHAPSDPSPANPPTWQRDEDDARADEPRAAPRPSPEPAPPPGWVTPPRLPVAPSAPAAAPATRPRRRLMWIVVGMIGAAVIGVGGWQLYLRLATPGTHGPGHPIAVVAPADAPLASPPLDAARLAVAVTPDAATVAAPPPDAVAPPADATAVAVAPPADAARPEAPADAARVAAATPDAGTPPADARAAPADAGQVAVVKPVAPSAAGDTLVIASTPPGARVFLDGADAGATPVKLPGSPDRHTIALLLAGHDLYIAQVDGHGTFQIPLKEVTPANGPAGIKVLRCKDKDRYYVFLDGKPTGQTCPTERIGCEVGPHTVEVYDVVSETRRKWDIVVKDTRLSFRVRVE